MACADAIAAQALARAAPSTAASEMHAAKAPCEGERAGAHARVVGNPTGHAAFGTRSAVARSGQSALMRSVRSALASSVAYNADARLPASM